MFGISPEQIIQSGGILLVGAIIFAESGLLVGFFLPGDTLLFSAGIFAAQDKLPLGWLILVVVFAAIIGDNVGYSIGRRAGPRLFRKPDSILFRQEYITKAEDFYERHGGKTIVLARFVPWVRTFAPVVAGAGKMSRKRFMVYNVLGATLWGVGVVMLGYALGNRIPSIDKYILPAVALATFLTFGPALFHLFSHKKTRQLFWSRFKLGVSGLFSNKKVD